MKIAFTVWTGRIAPVFDVAGQVLLYDGERYLLKTGMSVALAEVEAAKKVFHLKELGVNVLICGAISCSARALAESCGIEVFSFVAGDITEIIAAWQEQRLDRAAFAMPGCGGQRRSCCRRKRGRP